MGKKAKKGKAAAEPEVEIDPDLKVCGGSHGFHLGVNMLDPNVFLGENVRWCTHMRRMGLEYLPRCGEKILW